VAHARGTGFALSIVNVKAGINSGMLKKLMLRRSDWNKQKVLLPRHMSLQNSQKFMRPVASPLTLHVRCDLVGVAFT